MSTPSDVSHIHHTYQTLRTHIAQRIVGQDAVVENLLITLFSKGHALFVGVPGLAKTLLVHTLADVLDLSFNRVQFTPDLMPSDITGTDVLAQDHTGQRAFSFVQGPVFCNLLLADEINRTPPKTQAALLQCMQEGKITAGGKTYNLPTPFHVFATQNPIEQEGTYPLPEAQLDRFMMMLHVEYPSMQEEISVVKNTQAHTHAPLPKILSPDMLLSFQETITHVPIADPLIAYAVRLVRNTRPTEDTAPSMVKECVSFGAGPRAAQHVVLAAKTRALFQGRYAVDIEDIKALAPAVLRHRVMLNFHAESNNTTSDHIVAHVIDKTAW